MASVKKARRCTRADTQGVPSRRTIIAHPINLEASMKLSPSAARVREVLSLDVETGFLYWRITLGSRAKAGARAGTLHKATGYWFVSLDGVRYRSHVLIWLMLHNEWAPRRIDHRDRDRGNNRPLNLRKATESQQRQNTAKRSDNSSGERGVYLHKCGKFAAEVRVDGQKIWVGLFDSIKLAAEAVRDTRNTHFGAFAP